MKMKLDIQQFGGRGASSNTSDYSYAVKENPKYKKELGKARYAIQFREGIADERTISVIDFNSQDRTDNKEKSLHSLDAYGNMKIYQRTGASDIYLFTEEQMKKVNKKMPMRNEYEKNREKTMQKIEKLASQYADKVIKKRK